MAVLKRSKVAAPVLARETVSVPALGGDVVVSELLLDDRLDFDAVVRGAKRVSVHAMVPELLARAVLVEGDAPVTKAAADGDDGDADATPPPLVPLYTVEQWRTWGARHRDVAIELFNVAMRLSGFDGSEPAKN